MTEVSPRLHPNAPHNQPFNVSARPSKKRSWAKTRGHNNMKREGDRNAAS